MCGIKRQQFDSSLDSRTVQGMAATTEEPMDEEFEAAGPLPLSRLEVRSFENRIRN